jgi:hypothetical protein
VKIAAMKVAGTREKGHPTLYLRRKVNQKKISKK